MQFPYRVYTERAARVKRLLEQSIKFTNDYLDLPDAIVVNIRPIKAHNARYLAAKHLVEIDPRPTENLGVILATFCHELVHAEQYHQKKLIFKNGESFWMNQRCKNKGTTYKSYLNLPWEREAFGRQAELATKITNRIEQGF